MVTQLSPYPKFRAFDANGFPLAGGSLQTWEAGTTTPKATFPDQEGLTPNANPVILDANGEADVWLATDGLYQWELRDSAGALQWTIDNIGSATFTPQIDPGYNIPSATVELRPQAGDTVMKATGLAPSNSLLVGAVIYVTESFGAGQGLTGLMVGTEAELSRYGSGIALTATTESGVGDFLNYVEEPANAALDVLVTAETGPYDGTGALLLTAYWETQTPVQSL